MPSEDRVRRDESGHLGQDLPTQPVARCREAASLGVGQPQPPPAQVLFEHAILCPQVFDDFTLMAIHPARQGHEQNP
jgi:hypothetical protein